MTYPLAFQSPGGGEQIITESYDALTAAGASVEFFNPWSHQIKDFDIVHYFSCLTWWDWKTIKSYDVPLVLTPTAWPEKGSLHKNLDKVKEVARSRFGAREAHSLRSYFSYPDLLFPTTESEKALLEGFYDIPAQKMKVIGNGVRPPQLIKAEDNSFLKESGLEDYILFAGSLRPNKNVDTLIRACQKLSKKLVIMGESSFDTKAYEEHCREIAGDETIFLGYQAKGSALYDAVFNGSKIVVVPSDFETFCLAAAEGSAIGKPVIVPRSGGTGGVFGDDGFYIDNGRSVDELASKIKSVLDNDNSDSISRLMETMDRKFSWPSIASEMLAGYKSVL